METVPLATVKARFSEYVESVAATHERIVVTRRGCPAVVLIAVEDLESLEETVEVLSDPDALREIAEGEADLDRGEGVGAEEIKAIFAARVARREAAERDAAAKEAALRAVAARQAAERNTAAPEAAAAGG